MFGVESEVTDLRLSLLCFSASGRHWSRADDGKLLDSLEVEMTSYVLLALLSGPQLPIFDMGYTSSIVYWLAQQQNAFGGFASTQVRSSYANSPHTSAHVWPIKFKFKFNKGFNNNYRETSVFLFSLLLTRTL